MKIKINRQSVCLGDDMEDHMKTYQLDNDTTYEEFFHILKEDNYFPGISGNNVVWVLTTKKSDCIFSYFSRTGKFSAGLVEKKLTNICDVSGELFLKYFTTPMKWKEKIQLMYDGDTYSMWRDGWLKEIKYCDYVMELGFE